MPDVILWPLRHLLDGLANLFYLLIEPGAWPDPSDGEGLVRIVYFGASLEFLFIIIDLALIVLVVGLLKPGFLWLVVRGIEGLSNVVGRVAAWAVLVMVIQQIMIIALQRIFLVSEITVGPFGVVFTRDLSWFSEELKLYNAMIVTLCAAYTFVQGGHVRVDLVYASVSFRTKRLLDMFGSVFFVMPFCGVVWLFGWFFLWRHLITPKVSALDTLELLERKALLLRWNVETIGFSPNGFDAYFLFKVLLVSFAGLMFLQGLGHFYRSLLELREGEESANRYKDLDTVPDLAPETPAESTGAGGLMFGFDGVEVGLLITLVCLFAGILSGYPVAFAIGGSALVAFAVIAGLSESGLLVKEVIDSRSDDYAALVGSGVKEHAITLFRYPDLPTLTVPVFENGVDGAFFRILTFIVNRMNERVLAGPSIELLLAVAMFILMGISLERSRIAQDLLTSMARVFGALPGGLAVSVVVVGAFLAASTGIVGATVVTMGLLSLPTMLRNRYSPELATGVISASGTLGQIIPPSIVIVLLGTLAGDLYSTAQEERAVAAGCRDALTYLGEAAVVSVGTLFKAAIVPGLLLAFIYAAYVFCYALVRPSKAPPVRVTAAGLTDEGATLNHRLFWFLAVPGLVLVLAGGMATSGIAGPQTVDRLNLVERPESPELRTNVADECKEAMIELHGQEMWDRSLATAERSAAVEFVAPTDEELDLLEAEAIAFLPPVSEKLLIGLVFLGLVMSIAWGVAPSESSRPLLVGAGGIAATVAADAWLVTPLMSTGTAWLILALPVAAVLYGVRHALPRLARVEVLRVVFPPLVLIVAVLGSILGGVTSPTAAAGLGASGALMLSAYRRLSERKDHRKGRIIIMSAWAVVVFLLVGTSFDLRTSIEVVGFENWLAFIVSLVAYHIAFGGLVYSCVILYREGILGSVVRDTAKVTAMVFAILIGSQMLNLVVISYGGEEHIQEFLRSFDDEMVVFLVVMAVLFILGFVLDFLEIIYIVIPIVGPVIYGGTLDPKWVTIMIAVNLQTSFLTPPFGFALFYLRGVAPPEITTGQIYRGVVPFVIIQIVGLTLMWFLPEITTFLPELLPEH